MKLTLTLVGIHANKTIRLNKHQFVNGICTLDGAAQEVEMAAKILGRCYGAKTRDELDGLQRNSQAAPQQGNPNGLSGGLVRSPGKVLAERDLRRDGLDNDKPAAGQAGVGADGLGHEDPGIHPEKVRAIARVVSAFDPLNKDHWTEDGLPSVEIVSQVLEDHDITRRMIDVACPGLTLEKVAEASEL